MNPRACCRIDLGCVNPPIGEALSGNAHIGMRRISNLKHDEMVHAKIKFSRP
jgi:hypothetical protein